MTNQAEFITSTVDGVSVVAIHGEVDIANVEGLRLCLEKVGNERGPGLVVDLTRATYFDSRTIALLADFATCGYTASASRWWRPQTVLPHESYR